MKNWECITKKGFVLASGIETNNIVLMTYRADIGLVRFQLNNVQEAMKVAPTSYQVRYTNLQNPQS